MNGAKKPVPVAMGTPSSEIGRDVGKGRAEAPAKKNVAVNKSVLGSKSVAVNKSVPGIKSVAVNKSVPGIKSVAGGKSVSGSKASGRKSRAGQTKARGSAGRKGQRTQKRALRAKRFMPALQLPEELLPDSSSVPVERPREYYPDNAFMAGYEHGSYEGGEMLLEQAIPGNLLLPEVSLREVIELGAAQLRAACTPLMDVHEVFAEMEAAISAGTPCSVVRIGDGELLTLAQDGVFDAQTILREGNFLPYAGVNPPDLRAKEQLVQAIRQAHIVGIPLSRRRNFQPLLHPVFRSNGLSMPAMRMTRSTINYAFHEAGLLKPLLAGKRLLVVGDVAPALAHKLESCGFKVSGIVSPVNGMADIDRVMHLVQGFDFNLALVAAGIPAVVICTRIANELGRTALDFGHLADGLVKGKYAL